MDAHVNKIQDDKSKADARKLSEREAGIEGTFQFIDERPEGIAKRELQEAINNNPRTVQLLTIQELVNNSPRIKQLRAIQETAYNGRWGQQAVQLQAMASRKATKVLQRLGLAEPEEKEATVQKKENNTGLPDNLKSGIENLSGYTMDDVKVHYNSDKPARLNAHAYAQGADIHLASGQEKHLPHEAWHVVQQKQGRVQPTKQLKDKTITNDDESLEKEADIMGAKAVAYNATTTTAKTPIGSFTSTFSYSDGVVQGKFGVEYETKWTIDDADNVTANHKKKVFQGDGFHIESDNNDLEFVSMPPSDTPKALYDTVGRMKTKATGMIGNLRGNVEQPAPAGPFLKDNVEELLAAMALGEGTHKLRAVIEHITESGAITEGHIDHLAGKLHAEGWETGADVESADTIKGHDWKVGDLKGYITKEHFDGSLDKKPPPQYKWEDSNSLDTVLGEDAMGSFNGKNVLVPGEEETMKARPQFTFGVEMKDIPKLFKMFIDGPKGRDEDAQRELNYGGGAKEKLESYGKAKIGPGLEAGNSKAEGIFEANDTGELNADSKGFIHYLVYYINQMRTKEWASKDSSIEETKSTHIAQVLLNSLGVESEERFPIDDGKYTAGMKNIVLTGEDKAGIESDKALNESLQTALERGDISTAQKTKLSEYLETNLAKMKDDPVYPKHFFILMNRSGFDRMYDSLEAEQKGLVNTYMETKVIPEFLIDDHEDETLFKSPYYYKKKTGADSYERGVSYGPSLKEWWNSIKSAEQRQNITGEGLDDTTSKRDKLSPPSEFIDHTGKPDETQSLGSLNKMDGNLAVIELREWGNVMPAASWQEHTSDMLKAFAKNILNQVPDWDTG